MPVSPQHSPLATMPRLNVVRPSSAQRTPLGSARHTLQTSLQHLPLHSPIGPNQILHALHASAQSTPRSARPSPHQHGRLLEVAPRSTPRSTLSTPRRLQVELPILRPQSAGNIRIPSPTPLRHIRSLNSLAPTRGNKKMLRAELAGLDVEARSLLERHLKMRFASRQPDLLHQAIGEIW